MEVDKIQTVDDSGIINDLYITKTENKFVLMRTSDLYVVTGVIDNIRVELNQDEKDEARSMGLFIIENSIKE
jgi:hypothetical protein